MYLFNYTNWKHSMYLKYKEFLIIIINHLNFV